MKLLPSVVAILVLDLMSTQRKTYHRVLAGVRTRSASTVWLPSAREQSFYALIEQFWFVGSRHFRYRVWHESDFALPTLKLKPD